MRSALALQQLPGRIAILSRDRQKHVLRGDVFVLEVFGFLEGALQHIVQRATHVLLREAGHFRQPAHLALKFLRQHLAADSQPRQKRGDHAVGLRYQRGQQVHRLDLLIFVARGNFLRALQRFLRLDGHFFKSQHNRSRSLCRFLPKQVQSRFCDEAGLASLPAPLSFHN